MAVGLGAAGKFERHSGVVCFLGGGGRRERERENTTLFLREIGLLKYFIELLHSYVFSNKSPFPKMLIFQEFRGRAGGSGDF